ncbi:putative alcohol dehydrogenase AdhA [Candidatus Hydrogenisulfobacillus filiaventi]|uniref:alcohol dehydrogenase n=1 Tax=Candidatus Hydrogenisulfobacillus filiaventi TaxID=2707344 RepID=A0A6F8ZDS8_9FIRM|nr:zinc-binding alcohol dehydrogenase family protein [Bacillota bacterium]CAB1127917.1 putative alcohol dehydrogenase AdhA [Candidatus Hydrogenisulfobacillus filiaventi]
METGSGTMGAWVLEQAAPLEDARLTFRWRTDRPRPRPGPGEVLVEVATCGVCHTDLHTVEGELPLPAPGGIPGHQVVGRVVETAPDATEVCPPPGIDPGLAGALLAAAGQPGTDTWQLRPGTRVGVAWLYDACGRCPACLRGEENLCPQARFTGLSVPGGYAEALTAPARYLVPLPARFDDVRAAPLLCAGIIGYRSLRLAGVGPDRPRTLGLWGFGASAHLALQLARHWGCRVYVFTRSAAHRALALRLGAAWAGAAGDPPPEPLEAGITFAPVGRLIPQALAALAPGGVLAINAVHLQDGIPAFDYRLLYGERVLRSVANATRRDAWEWMYWADQAGVEPEVERWPMSQAREALVRVKAAAVQGSAVLVRGGDS